MKRLWLSEDYYVCERMPKLGQQKKAHFKSSWYQAYMYVSYQALPQKTHQKILIFKNKIQEFKFKTNTMVDIT